ncbi:MAG: putative DNA binding domain-containing protein [Methanomassiliicoccaceae archaeon]|nr:putative DNA binding domain-containing protein [Methanomassiliicoccaceae archaeon]
MEASDMINDLDIILSEGEGYKIEFKKAPDKDLATEVCAFANSSGGRIFIGITDDRDVVGTDTSNPARSKIQDTINNIEPRPDTTMEVHGDIIVITVHEGKKKPYSCSKGFYLRSGPNSQKLDREGIIEFLQSEDIIRYDSKVRNEFRLSDRFDVKAYGRFIQKAGISDILPYEQILMNLDCAKRNQRDELVFTNAGALFFRDNTEDNFFGYAKIVCAIFKGTDKAKTIDAKEFNGNIMDNIDGAMKYLWQNLRVRHEFGGIQRREIMEIPVDALREAVINAVCHRNYFEAGANVMVEIYDDRVEISNPGGLPKGLSADELGIKSLQRNPIIADMLHRAGYIERMGTGIRKIRNVMTAAGLDAPVFTSTYFFTAVFKRPPLYVPNVPNHVPNVPNHVPNGALQIPIDTTDDDLILLVFDHIKKNSSASIDEIAHAIERNDRTVKRIIRALKDRGAIRRVGSKRSGHWELLETEMPADMADTLNDLTSAELKVYDIIVEGHLMTRVEMAEYAGVSFAAVKRAIIKLTEKGLIKRVGNDRNGRWFPNTK